MAVVEGESTGAGQFETDRAGFLGRGRVIRTPISVIDGQPLSNTVGTVLDPIFSLRRRVRIPAGAPRHRRLRTEDDPTPARVLDVGGKPYAPARLRRAGSAAST